MRMLFGVAALVSAAAATAQSGPQQPPVPDTATWTAEQFRAAAIGDVEAAYRYYRDNHPGVHDANNRGFVAQLDGARDKAMALAREASDRGGYADALGAFSVALADHHATLGLRSASGAAPQFQWPGFLPAWRDRSLFVHSAEPGSGMVRGDRIVGCDGLEPGALVRRNLSTSASYPLVPGEYWFVGGAPFNSTPETQSRRAQVCKVAGADGQERTVTLQWRDAPADFVERRAVARLGEKTPIGLTQPRPGIFLIGMPTFSPDNTEIAAYETLFKDLEARRAAMLKARAIVIDLRHNQGGSSSWSAQAGRILWGPAAVADVFASRPETAVWWRASEDNARFVGEWEDRFKAQGRPKEDIDWAHKTAAAMRKAIAAKETFYVERDDDDSDNADTATRHAPVAPLKTPVYVITHGYCGSACLDAVDLFKGFDTVKLIGSPTAFDTDYMDVRSETLPSGLGRVVIPMKVYVGRKRPSGYYYTPDILVSDIDWSPKTFLDRIEADLAQTSR